MSGADNRQLGLFGAALNDDGPSEAPIERRRLDDEWVSPSRLRNYVTGNPLNDWLELFGEQKGFIKDTDVDGYDPRLEFTEFIFAQGNAFEAAIIKHLETKFPVVRVAQDRHDNSDPAAFERTVDVMRSGAPLIHQAVLFDHDAKTYGAPDLLVRSDVLLSLFPSAFDHDSAHEKKSVRIDDDARDEKRRQCAAKNAPLLGDGGFHYRVIDVKFKGVKLAARSGLLGNDGSFPSIKVQIALYSRMLAKAQGYAPPVGYVLGRGYEQGKGDRGRSAMDRLGPIAFRDDVNKMPLDALIEDALRWIRRCRREGANWNAIPAPSVEELRPNMGGHGAFPWQRARKEIAKAQGELSQIWMVSAAKRDEALASDPSLRADKPENLSAAVLGVHGEANGPILDAMLAAQVNDGSPPVKPKIVNARRRDWHHEGPLDLYVDFETVSDLADTFKKIPARDATELIFMIGMGHFDKSGAWQSRVFTVDTLTMDDEAKIIDAWFEEIERLKRARGVTEHGVRVYHWSHAEQSTFETALRSARARHAEKEWADVPWFDFLKDVMKKEPVVVRGATAFGLKAVGRALKSHGLIETEWRDGPTDGLGAMVGAWRAEERRQKEGGRLIDDPLMKEIETYNDVDCRVMAEIIRYLRRHH